MIETRNLTKRYGELTALSNLTLKIERGDIYGFIGPNGAGKTTTLKILATLLEPDEGEAYVCGYSVLGQARYIRRRIGFMPDFIGVYEDLTVAEYLEFFGALYRLDARDRRKIVGDVLELTDLSVKSESPVRGLSRGMTQRLGLARLLLHDPDVLLLDEPASGLDPRARVEIRELLKELRSMGKTIVISSHILHELHELCNKVGIIEQGKLLFSGTTEEIMNKVREKSIVHIRLEKNQEDAAEDLAKDDHVVRADIQGGEIIVELKTGHPSISFLNDKLVRNGYSVTRFHEQELDLEDAFMRFTEGIVA